MRHIRRRGQRRAQSETAKLHDSRLSLRHDERAAIAAAVHAGVVHLLGMSWWTNERSSGRCTSEVGGGVGAGPENGRRVDDAIVADLTVIERRPPARIPIAVRPDRR